MKQNLITITAEPISIKANFEAAEKYLQNELKKYDVVVTRETIKGCKTLSSDLNKIATDIDKRRKSELSVMTAPIKDFDASMKSLVTICKDGRAKITEQIKVFEDETRATIEDLLEDYLCEAWNKLCTEERFRSATIDGLIVLSSLTANGNLSAKATSAIKERCMADKQKQNETETRLLKLENECYKAGLTTTLEEVHVAAFLFETEDVYIDRLTALISAELSRQEAAEEKMRKQLKKEAQAAESAKADEEEPIMLGREEINFCDMNEDLVKVQAEPEKTQEVEKPKAKEGNTMHVINARFEISLPSHIPVAAVIAKLEKVMIEAGITTLKTITEVK